MKKIYDYYRSIFASNQDMLWAGMAKLAGNTVWNACELSLVGGTLTSASGNSQKLVAEVQRQLLTMNLEIFMDLAWQHEAFLTSGIDEMRARHAAGEIDESTLEAWEYINAGIVEGMQGWVNKGNEMLLEREQMIILDRGYRVLARLNLGKIMGALAESPIPGGRSFAVCVPGGDLTDFADRWKWIQKDMLRIWVRFPNALRQRLVDFPLGTTVDTLKDDVDRYYQKELNKTLKIFP